MTIQSSTPRTHPSSQSSSTDVLCPCTRVTQRERSWRISGHLAYEGGPPNFTLDGARHTRRWSFGRRNVYPNCEWVRSTDHLNNTVQCFEPVLHTCYIALAGTYVYISNTSVGEQNISGKLTRAQTLREEPQKRGGKIVQETPTRKKKKNDLEPRSKMGNSLQEQKISAGIMGLRRKISYDEGISLQCWPKQRLPCLKQKFQWCNVINIIFWTYGTPEMSGHNCINAINLSHYKC